MEHLFKDTIDVLDRALRSVDEVRFEKLILEAKETLLAGDKVIASGLGKNVPICEKFVGTLWSLGLNAGFLHTNSAVHGDMGMVRSGDLVILLTKSGATTESVYLAHQLLKRRGVNIWLLTFSSQSPLVDLLGEGKCVVVELEHEGDPWNIVPNDSTTVNLIILQTLAMRLAQELNLELERDFKPNHPGGAIGERLR